MSIHVGCGSWADPEYTGLLYPRGVKPPERLPLYARWFDYVEINSSYYATPRAALTKSWVEHTPPGFTFDVKLHRAFSQSPEKSARAGDLVEQLLEGIEPLIQAKKLGVLLLVLAPSFGPEQRNLAELDALIEKLNPHRLAVELRHSDWVDGEHRAATLQYFRKNKLVWVAVDMPQIKESTIMPPLDEVTNPHLAYLRLHGRNPHWLEAKTAADRHIYEYSAAELKSLVARIEVLARQAKEVHVVANNHAFDFAPKTALALRHLLEQTIADPPSVK